MVIFKKTIMKKVFVFLNMLLSLGMFSACSSDDSLNGNVEGQEGNFNEPTTTFYNQWVLVSYGNESNEALKEAEGYYYLITFHPDGTYSGKAYGNEMGGEYKLNGKEIHINRADITQVSWVGSDPDQFFLEHLTDVYTYTITDVELRLYYSKDQYFKFRIKNDQS